MQDSPFKNGPTSPALSPAPDLREVAQFSRTPDGRLPVVERATPEPATSRGVAWEDDVADFMSPQLTDRKHSVKLDRKSLPGLLSAPDTDVQFVVGEGGEQPTAPEHMNEEAQEEVVHEVVMQVDAGPEELERLALAGVDVSGMQEHAASADGTPARMVVKTHKIKAKKPKLTAPSTWLKVDNKGEAALIQVDKHKLTHKLGVQTRDLRILDPQLALSSPPAILDREKAIVVNLEHVKCIITLNYVLVVNPELESSAPLVSELKTKLAAGRMGKKAVSYTGLSDAASNVRLISTAAGGFDLPFELKALEVCLDMISVHLDEAAKTLEAEAYPTLDSLTHRVGASNLERTRRIKNRLVRLKTRVETIREVLEKFLNDDEDMHRLHLTGNEIQRQVSMHQEQQQALHAHDDDDASSASSDSSVDEAETAAVEMLLEAYFMYLDSTYNRLQTLSEYIGDTEDLVSIKLDQHRNQLIAVDLCLTSFSAALGIMTVVGGYFGMNLYSGLHDNPQVFKQVSITTTMGGLMIFGAFVYWLYRMKLLTY